MSKPISLLSLYILFGIAPTCKKCGEEMWFLTIIRKYRKQCQEFLFLVFTRPSGQFRWQLWCGFAEIYIDYVPIRQVGCEIKNKPKREGEREILIEVRSDKIQRKRPNWTSQFFSLQRHTHTHSQSLETQFCRVEYMARTIFPYNQNE